MSVTYSFSWLVNNNTLVIRCTNIISNYIINSSIIILNTPFILVLCLILLIKNVVSLVLDVVVTKEC